MQHPAQQNGFASSANVILPDDPLNQQTADIILDKLHVRGLDNLSSGDVKQFAGEHFPLDEFERIEWVDDTSANLIYATAQAASEALHALTDSQAIAIHPNDIHLTQLRPAKRISHKPDSNLFIRQATTIDVKKKGAHQVSRYYLFNPEQDPRERKRQQQHQQPRRGAGRRGSDGGSEYRRRQFDDREHKRRREDTSYSANMYDDDDTPDTPSSHVTEDRRKRVRIPNDHDDWFRSQFVGADGRFLELSVSPPADGDGKMGFGTTDDDDDDAYDRSRRARQRSPGNKNAGKELFGPASSAATTAAKELFPHKASGSGGVFAHKTTTAEPSPRELFPDKGLDLPGLQSSLELLPSKRSSYRNHRRSDAFDASRLSGIDFFASVTPPPSRERSLADRITGGPSVRPSTAPHEGGASVRGAAEAVDQPVGGLSIKGAGSSRLQHQSTARELFPLKAGSNMGKELFGEKIKGRGGPRRRAEDMFS
jgi:hypothetical protein